MVETVTIPIPRNDNTAFFLSRLAEFVDGAPNTHSVLAQVEREPFTDTNSATSGRLILRVARVPRSAVEDVAKVIGKAVRKAEAEAAKKAAKKSTGPTHGDAADSPETPAPQTTNETDKH